MPGEPPSLRCHVLDTGWCYASEHMVLRGGAHRTLEFHGLVGLLHHPEQGWTLFDTGYAPRVVEATERWPYRLYRQLTPMKIPPELALVPQLERLGVGRGDVRRIVISHFHADHLGGLRDFPEAEFVTLREAYESVAGRTGLSALRRAFLPPLMPADFQARAKLLPAPSGPPLPGLGATHDLFGDGSALLMALPGHARGQIGLLANTDGGRVLFAADGAWHSRAVRERIPPARAVRLIVDDFAATVRTIQNLHDFSKACPDVRIVPTHCPEALAREVGR